MFKSRQVVGTISWQQIRWRIVWINIESKTNPVIRESAILVDRVDLCDFGADRLSFQDRLLFPFGEQRYFVVHVFQHDVHRRFGRELLSSVVLQKSKLNLNLKIH